ncbi:hypothetical protein GJAV_G00270360 [Gymnothorax javanicus]|nr:hypothetical protein GJAV_G00270360 [Gymnothorax javanicus]
MSSVKEAAIIENGKNAGGFVEWDRTERKERDSSSVGKCSAQTQTTPLTEDKQTQTGHPVIMRIDLLPRTPSKLRSGVLLETEGVLASRFQFDRHAPGRISTSPTLRRMRTSPRRPRIDFRNPANKEENKPSHPNLGDDHIILRRLENLKTDRQSQESSEQEPEPPPNRLQERRRSSVVVSLPGLDVSPGDLFVTGGAADRLNGSTFSESKKSKWPFSRNSTIKGKKRSASDIEKCLTTVQIQNWRKTDFQRYKNCSLEEFLKSEEWEGGAKDGDGAHDWKRETAVWELFTSECVYFLDQLMVLKEVFLSTLNYLQDSGCLPDVDPWRLFANLHELSLVSFGFLTNLLRAIRESWDMAASGSAPTLQALLTKGFKDSICLSQQKYCLNYPTAISYLDGLKQRNDFSTYVKWCERKEECRRLYLQDLLVERSAVQAVAELVEGSIHDLEGKVKWLDNYQKVKRLRESLVWEPVWERDRRAFVPESLRHLMKAVSLENLVANRNLLHEGRLALIAENGKQQDVCLFLFDEFLLITKVKRNKKLGQKSGGLEQGSAHTGAGQELQALLKEGRAFVVLDQPLSLDRIQLRNIDQLNATASGQLNSFIVTHQNRYQQCIGVFLLQAPSESAKKAWMLALEGAVEALQKQDSQQPRLKNSSWLESTQI